MTRPPARHPPRPLANSQRFTPRAIRSTRCTPFYKGTYKEFSMRSTGPTLPSGQQVKWYFFILDGGTTLANSKLWMKIQHPYVGGADGTDIRDLTIIQTVRSK